MKECLAILALCALTTACTEKRVIQDNSVTAKFAAFNKSGWSVSGGGIKKNMPAQQGPDVKVISSSNPLSHPVFKTNFQVDPADDGLVAPGGFDPPPPTTPGSPLLGGFMVPRTTGDQATTRPAGSQSAEPLPHKDHPQ